MIASTSPRPSQVSQPDRLLEWMQCLSDPTRLRLLRLVERHELGVAELCDILQLHQPTVSRHLKVLVEAGWVRGEGRGTTNLYRSVLDEADPAARRLWALAREQMQSWATLRQDDLRLQRRISDRKTDSQAFFAGAAGQWDKLRGELYGQAFTASAIGALLPADWTIADLGCGAGQVAVELAHCVGRVIGVDNSADMLKAARQRTSGLSNVELRHGDLNTLPIETGACDAAMLVLALTYVPDPAAAIADARRILRPAGRLVVVDLLPHDRDDFRRQMGQRCLGFDRRMVEKWMQRAGFTSSATRDLAPEPAVKGPGLFLGVGCARA